MDQKNNRDIFELSRMNNNRSNLKIDLNNQKNPLIIGNKTNEKNKCVARRRWAILAKALKSPSSSPTTTTTADEEISIRRISSFMLFEIKRIYFEENSNFCKKRTWFEYILKITSQMKFNVKIGHRNRSFSAEDLMGFNNTGNVCIWPSEETLSYYVCLNLNLFRNKHVLELGGGMSCLAGLFVAKYAKAHKILLTDGNKRSIENVETILKANELNSSTTNCRVLKWAEINVDHNFFDIILSADCLFFDDARTDFISCLFEFLHPNGVAFVMAPQRGKTLQNFIEQSEMRGLNCKKITNYSDLVWKKRLNLLAQNSDEFNDNIHYPILIHVTKKKKSFPIL